MHLKLGLGIGPYGHSLPALLVQFPARFLDFASGHYFSGHLPSITNEKGTCAVRGKVADPRCVFMAVLSEDTIAL